MIAAQSEADVRPHAGVSLEEVALNAGRPLLVLPYIFASRRSDDHRLGHRVLVAWNGSAQASRAVHDALPFLRSSEETVVLTIYDGEEDHLSSRLGADRMVEHLRRHGVKAREEVDTHVTGISPSDLILDRVSDFGCDLLVMGAYSRSRLREGWFGGASRDLFAQMTVPVLTSH